MHPAPGRQGGWDEVRAAREQIASLNSDGKDRARSTRPRRHDLAYTIGTERVEVILAGQQVQLELRVTNIYRREAGGWKMVHHHTDLSPEIQDILSRLNLHRHRLGTNRAPGEIRVLFRRQRCAGGDIAFGPHAIVRDR